MRWGDERPGLQTEGCPDPRCRAWTAVGAGNDDLEGDREDDFLNGGTGSDDFKGGPVTMYASGVRIWRAADPIHSP